MRKIHYFLDGAASQYKNYKNFCSLVFHHVDFSLKAEWNFLLQATEKMLVMA